MRDDISKVPFGIEAVNDMQFEVKERPERSSDLQRKSQAILVRRPDSLPVIGFQSIYQGKEIAFMVENEFVYLHRRMMSTVVPFFDLYLAFVSDESLDSMGLQFLKLRL